MAIPIIFVHQRDSFYLKYSLKQAKHFNRDSAVYLLGDELNDKYPSVTHVNLKEYKESADGFATIYKHRSSNPHDYELFCFQRWFYIRDFVKANKIEEFIYLDSDVLAFYHFQDIVKQFAGKRIINTGENIGMPAFSYFSNFDAISGFCEYLTNYYTNSKLVNILDDWYSAYLNNAIAMSGGICDMTIFDFFFKDNPNDTMKADVVGDVVFDENIRAVTDYESNEGFKKIYWRNNLPYCRSLKTGTFMRLATLHYQGESKEMMIKHYRGEGYDFARLQDATVITFNKAKVQLKTKIKELIRYHQ